MTFSMQSFDHDPLTTISNEEGYFGRHASSVLQCSYIKTTTLNYIRFYINLLIVCVTQRSQNDFNPSSKLLGGANGLFMV